MFPNYEPRTTSFPNDFPRPSDIRLPGEGTSSDSANRVSKMLEALGEIKGFDVIAEPPWLKSRPSALNG